LLEKGYRADSIRFPMEGEMAKVYISGALTGVSKIARLKQFYEKIGELCGANGQEAYVPHLHTDPIKHSGLTPREIFTTDKYHVRTADLVIAYVGMPSLGVGMELAYAEALGIPIVLLYEEHARVSKFSLGIPTVISRIKFRNFDHALAQLSKILSQIRGKPVRQVNSRMSVRRRVKTSLR
jgi:2'-deoxynucleoside 5'-phosphate N-hydrolase